MLKSTNIILICTLVVLVSACASSRINDNNEVSISPGTRTLGTIYDDQYIETTATKLIKGASLALEDSHFSVVSINSVVLLAGQVPDELSRTQAAQIIQTIPNIRQVHNNLTVAPSITLLDRANDALITAHVKTIMIGETNFPFTRVKVFTEDRAVYLMGLVTQEEANWAVNIAQRGSGVRKIVKIFEYID